MKWHKKMRVYRKALELGDAVLSPAGIITFAVIVILTAFCINY